MVVGAGSAGAAMAARLSEEPTLRVTLVEAGSDTVPGEVPDDIKDIFPRSFLNSDYFWPNLTASLTDGDAARPFPQARVVGGGSSVMGMIALRGLPSDYDGWEARGARNWGWRDVLPYFRAMTCDLDRLGPERNISGPNIIHRLPREKWPVYMRRIEAVVASRGMKSLSDINETAEDGFFATPLSQDRERASSARCYRSRMPRLRRGRPTRGRRLGHAECAQRQHQFPDHHDLRARCRLHPRRTPIRLNGGKARPAALGNPNLPRPAILVEPPVLL